MPVRPLPSRPNLDHLRHQAKDLLREHAGRRPAAAQRIREFHPRFERATDAEIFNAGLSLSDAQMTVAREYGFPSWTRLKRRIEQPTPTDRVDRPHQERIEDEAFRRAVDLLDEGDVAGLRAYLEEHRQLVHQHVEFEGGNYFRQPTLLNFVAENPVRKGVLPADIVEVARVILNAGADESARNETLLLVASGSVARECGVQVALIDLLCAYGADANAAMSAAVLHGELEAVRALLVRGAQVNLEVAVALERSDDFRRLMPAASGAERHGALALAAHTGRLEMVRALLDAGEDANRYNPVGGHSHSTPLHEAALGGHDAVVRLLVERGVRLDTKDLLWHATAADWARYEGRTEVEEYLRRMEKGG